MVPNMASSPYETKSEAKANETDKDTDSLITSEITADGSLVDVKCVECSKIDKISVAKISCYTYTIPKSGAKMGIYCNKYLCEECRMCESSSDSDEYDW